LFFLTGHVKAQYALGYFTEMGIGCRRDPLEANVWYVRAADAGYENARQRLEVIRAAAAGGPGADDGLGQRTTTGKMVKAPAKAKDLKGEKEKDKDKNGSEKGEKEKKKFMGIF
jgi:TPR repeat protein